MGIINIIIIVIVVFTFIYRYVKNRKQEETGLLSIDNLVTNTFEDMDQVIAAVIAIIMEDRPHRTRNVYISNKEEKISTWRVFGRQQRMGSGFLERKRGE